MNINDANEDAVLAGSGTLVSIGDRKFILTADHVLKNLPNRGPVGLLLENRSPPQLQRVEIQMDMVDKITVARGSSEARGPDLGIMLLHGPMVGTIAAKKSFYDLTTRRDRILSKPAAIRLGLWGLSGSVSEWTEDAPPEQGFNKVKIFRGMLGLGDVTKESEARGYDYLEFEAQYDEAYEGPDSFAGLSGGGLWHCSFERHEDGSLSTKEVILSGVAFYQSSKKDDRRTIMCHGRRSIYGSVIDVVASNTTN